MINIFYNLYVDPDPVRDAELVYSYQQTQVGLPDIASIQLIDGRPTFREYFDLIKEVSLPNDINVIINSDCWLEHSSLPYIFNITYDEVWCVSRRDVLSVVPFIAGDIMTDRQDCWIFRGNFLKDEKNLFCDFTQGIFGCDLRLAYEFVKVGYTVKNPCDKVLLYHYHLSNLRRYSLIGPERIPAPYHRIPYIR